MDTLHLRVTEVAPRGMRWLELLAAVHPVSHTVHAVTDVPAIRGCKSSRCKTYTIDEDGLRVIVHGCGLQQPPPSACPEFKRKRGTAAPRHRYIWLTPDDARHGQVFSYTMEPDLERVLLHLCPPGDVRGYWSVLEAAMQCTRVHVVYHGTHREAARSIGKTLTFHASERGLFGSAVYAGSFSKACRFAAFTHTHTRHKSLGVTLRCLVFAAHVVYMDAHRVNVLHNRCVCSRCAQDTTGIARWTDHRGNWMTKGTDALVCVDHVVQNEEWAVRADMVLPCHEAELVADSVPRQHDPVYTDWRAKLPVCVMDHYFSVPTESA